MKKGIGTPENRDLAYQVYLLLGGRDVRRVLRRLEARHGLKISARTLYEWKQEGDWDGRMARDGAERMALRQSGLLTFDERILFRVLGLIEKYEGQFRGGEALDNQAAYAYTNLLRTAMDLSKRMRYWEMTDLDDFFRNAPPSPAGPEGRG